LEHDIPSRDQCNTCHGTLSERLLGFSAIQLSHDQAEVNIPSLVADGRLSDDPPSSEGYTVPGDAVAQTALGYLHANCGGCHHSTGVMGPASGMYFRLLTGDTSVEQTGAFSTAVDVGANRTDLSLGDFRIAGAHPENSLVIGRMGSRVPGTQMPPLGTKLPHEAGIDAVSAWISSLPEADAGL
jgi:mono/diheme cytochrome c family protein